TKARRTLLSRCAAEGLYSDAFQGTIHEIRPETNPRPRPDGSRIPGSARPRPVRRRDAVSVRAGGRRGGAPFRKAALADLLPGRPRQPGAPSAGALRLDSPGRG